MRKKTRKLLKSGALLKLKKVTLGNYPHTQVTMINTKEEINKVRKEIARQEKEYKQQLKRDEKEYKKELQRNNPNPKQNRMQKFINVFRKTRKNSPRRELAPTQYKSYFKEKSSSSTQRNLRRSLEKNNKRLEELGIDPERLTSFTIDSNHPRGFRVEYR